MQPDCENCYSILLLAFGFWNVVFMCGPCHPIGAKFESDYMNQCALAAHDPVSGLPLFLL